MPASKNKIAYINQYKRENERRFALSFSKINDADVIEQIEKQKSKNDYIRQLVRRDMGK